MEKREQLFSFQEQNSEDDLTKNDVLIGKKRKRNDEISFEDQ